jgi:hypothetical protein
MPRTEVTSFGRTVVVMDMRRLGNSGLTVSVVGLGGNNRGRAGTATETADGAAAVVNARLPAAYRKYRRGTAPEGSRLTRSRPDLLQKADFEQLGRFSAFAAAPCAPG